jgi:hypothetical protein
MNTGNLCIDNIILICQFLYNKDIVQYLSICKIYHAIKNKVDFDYNLLSNGKNFVSINKIKDLWYYDRFTHVCMNCHIYNIIRFPLRAQHVTLETNYMGILDKPLINYFHRNVKHLTIVGTYSCFRDNLSFSNLIPSTITHLIWINPLDKTYLKDRIPSNVINLTIKTDYIVIIYNLPETIINLTIENRTRRHINFIVTPKIKNMIIKNLFKI